MNTTISKDGTRIAFERQGQGPAVILVGGGLVDESENTPLAGELSSVFTVYNYARRGRSESGNTLPYAVEREIEDIEILINEAGGSAHLFGVSSGGALVLEAAMANLKVGKLVVYEVPYMVGNEAIQSWQAYVKNLQAADASGDRGKMLELFMELAGSSEEDIAGAKTSDFWPGGKEIAPTLMYDAACIGLENGAPPTKRLASISQPTLVLTGTMLDPHMSGLQPSFFANAADAIAGAIPNATRKNLENQTHALDPKVATAELAAFFGS